MSLFYGTYYNENDLHNEGFASLGKNIHISTTCTVVGTKKILIGDNVRIDGYTTIIAVDENIVIGSNIHIGSGSLLIGKSGILMEDYSCLSHGVQIFTVSDDYSGEYMTNPMIPERLKKTHKGRVSIGRHVIIGSGSIILPNVRIGEGVAVGALSLVNKDLAPWGIYAGIPAKLLRERSMRILELEKEL
jgi:galactoside O-acetyltransferase